jgi:acyl-coenzyme A thioesterase PaaI-like protein
VIEGCREAPPANVPLGWGLESVDPDAGTVEVSFTATEEFLNRAGQVPGGFVAAMLDETSDQRSSRPCPMASGRRLSA